MCELDVYMKRLDSSAKVASEVVYAGVDRGTLVLKDIVGSAKKFEGIIISEVDINRERMELRESPILGPVLEFISAYDDCLSKGKYETDLQDRWEELKACGDEMVRDLWTEFEKANVR